VGNRKVKDIWGAVGGEWTILNGTTCVELHLETWMDGIHRKKVQSKSKGVSQKFYGRSW